LGGSYKISPTEMNDYYRDHQKEFIRTQDEVHLIHLLLEQRDNAIFKEIGQTKDLLTIVKKYYFDQKSTRERPNGDLGYVALNDLPAIFVRTLKRLKIGAISRPIKTDQGYHFLQLLDWQKKGTVRDLQLVKNDILIRLQQEHFQEEKEKLLKEEKAKAQIQTYLSKIQD